MRKITGFGLILGIMLLGLTACGQDQAAAPVAEEEVAVTQEGAEGLAVIARYDSTPVEFYNMETIEAENDRAPEALRGKESFHYVEKVEFSPKEYFYLPETGEAYVIKEGCWFLLNEDFKNVTPDNPEDELSMYEEAESMRSYIMENAVPQN